MQIVVGDFNRDGILDVVTGNRSSIARDDCATMFKTWDSVSVLAGLANGTFVAARHFSIGDQTLMDPADAQTDKYRSTLTSLNTSDVDGDGETDLIASNGAILFNIAAVPNRAPLVNAGPDTLLVNTHDIIFRPAAWILTRTCSPTRSATPAVSAQHLSERLLRFAVAGRRQFIQRRREGRPWPLGLRYGGVHSR